MTRFDEIDRLLEERGLSIGRARVAAGRSGVAIGFPPDPVVHLSWWALSAAGLTAMILRRRKRR